MEKLTKTQVLVLTIGISFPIMTIMVFMTCHGPEDLMFGRPPEYRTPESHAVASPQVSDMELISTEVLPNQAHQSTIFAKVRNNSTSAIVYVSVSYRLLDKEQRTITIVQSATLNLQPKEIWNVEIPYNFPNVAYWKFEGFSFR